MTAVEQMTADERVRAILEAFGVAQSWEYDQDWSARLRRALEDAILAAVEDARADCSCSSRMAT